MAAFGATNLDDLFLLIAWFAAGRARGRDIVVGQALGMGVLFLASATVALLAWALPAELVVWLGVLPILYGLGMLVNRSTGEEAVPPAAGIAAVASTTLANGSDNLAVYIPLLATASGSEVAVIGGTFAAMTGLWCLAARWLVSHPEAGAPLRRYGPHAVPYVLIAVGAWILLR